MKVDLAWSTRRLFTAAVLAGLCASAALAQSWSEPRYNPQVGSHWRIESHFDSEQTRAPRGPNRLHGESIAELTIDAKRADGFRVSYVIRKIGFTGNGREVSAMNAAFSAMQGVLVQVRTDAAGRPVAVENIAEVRGVMRQAIDRMIASLADKPDEAAMVKRIIQPLLFSNSAKATKFCLGNLPRLAAAQNTGLQPGEVRRVTQDINSPFGGPPIKAMVITRLVAWDDAAGTARVLSKRQLEPGALKAATLALMRQAIAATGKPMPPKMAEMFKKFDLQVDSETIFDLRNGMTRRLERRSTTTANGFGHTVRKQQTELVTVTRLPN